MALNVTRVLLLERLSKFYLQLVVSTVICQRRAKIIYMTVTRRLNNLDPCSTQYKRLVIDAIVVLVNVHV